MTDNRTRNRALVEFLLLPTIFLSVALLGGLRVGAETGAFVFVAPPLVALVLAVLLMLLVARGRMVEVGRWLSGDNHPLTNVAHALTLLTLFFASAQSFNSVLPERGLLRWMFSFFFLWTLWNDQFSRFNARRLLRSLAVLFGTAFLLKHMLLASLYAPGGGWMNRLAGVLLEGVTLGTLDAPAYAPATGYISFFALALYVLGLLMLRPAPEAEPHEQARAGEVVRAYRRLLPEERASFREKILSEVNSAGAAREENLIEAPPSDADEVDDEEDETERTLVRRKTQRQTRPE